MVFNFSTTAQEYMNVDNREYVFRVLNDVTKLPFLAEAMNTPWGDQRLQGCENFLVHPSVCFR